MIGTMVEHGTLPWLNFVEARVEEKSFSGICGKFQNMHQEGAVHDYLTKFEHLKTILLMSRPHLDEGYFVENFIEGG